MKLILYTNYFLLIATPLAFLIKGLGAHVDDLPQFATLWLAVYQLIIGICIALYRIFHRESILIWFYWLGVILFFAVALPNSDGTFPWYWPTLLAIYFSYVLRTEIKPNESK